MIYPMWIDFQHRYLVMFARNSKLIFHKRCFCCLFVTFPVCHLHWLYLFLFSLIFILPPLFPLILFSLPLCHCLLFSVFALINVNLLNVLKVWSFFFFPLRVTHIYSILVYIRRLHNNNFQIILLYYFCYYSLKKKKSQKQYFEKQSCLISFDYFSPCHR